MNANERWDAIVVGSGMGGLACAAALARFGRRVLVLERHYVAGGLTHTFSRQGFTWDVGVHYLGQFGPHGATRRTFEWLAGAPIEMASMGPVYDTVHFPDGFEFAYARPVEALRRNLVEAFPAHAHEIDAWLAAIRSGVQAVRSLQVLRMMPRGMAAPYRWWKQHEIDRWVGRTTQQVADEILSDPRLRAVLTAQWADYGGAPANASFAMHAQLASHYLGGAWYPVGGAASFANALVPAIESAGGSVRTSAGVERLVVDEGRVVGVRTESGETFRAPHVFSGIGARETVTRLLPESMRGSQWVGEILSFRPNVAHVCLYLGLEGDIHAHGATKSNHWFFQDWEAAAGIWADAFEEAEPKGIFVSFPSLKDPAHDPGARRKHTAEVVALVEWDAFAAWAQSHHESRPGEYESYKDVLERHLLAMFGRLFPGLAPLVVYHELSTPLSTVAFTGHAQGAFYGLEVTPRRFLSRSLDAATPIPGLRLTGQDTLTPGVAGAMFGGVLSAAGVEPLIFRHVGG
ncbi:MAG: NAD(P)/FAD-dependent oxidoreductase [Burkholderiales bacterium]|jgi:all-trans-retinol 13,14-reductase|nr:NAD(P)/FAD-dependent oxidoreductase [Burkholderiales bacterium]